MPWALLPQPCCTALCKRILTAPAKTQADTYPPRPTSALPPRLPSTGTHMRVRERHPPRQYGVTLLWAVCGMIPCAVPGREDSGDALATLERRPWTSLPVAPAAPAIPAKARTEGQHTGGSSADIDKREGGVSCGWVRIRVCCRKGIRRVDGDRHRGCPGTRGFRRLRTSP